MGNILVVRSTIPLIMAALLVPVTLFGVAFAYLESVTSNGSATVFESAAPFWAGAFVVLGMSCTMAFTTRRVILSGDGVTFVRGFSRTTVRWGSLRPPRFPYWMGIAFHYAVDPGVDPRNAFFNISRGQARAILADPRCPPLDLSPEMLKSIGLPADWRQPNA